MTSTRRQFLQAAGALAIYFTIPACTPQQRRVGSGQAVLGNRLVVEATGEVRLLLAKVEFGQGIGTALAQMAAEELDIDFSRIRLVPVDTDISADESYTFSSISIQQSGPPTRNAAAAARNYLVTQAAQRLGVAADSINVVDGRIHVNGTATELDYWQLIGDQITDIDIAAEQALKPTDQYSIVGQSYQRIDIPAKVFGGPSYLQDLRLADMVHARVVRPAAERAALQDFDASGVESLPGVLKVVRDGNFVAVVATREQQARTAARELHRLIEWDRPGDMPQQSSIFEWLKSAESRLEPIAEHTAPEQTEAGATVSRTYQRLFQAHASISPAAAIAHYDGERLTVWSHAQGMFPLRTGIAHVLGLDIENVRCLHFEASGCYGHNGADDAACDAAAIAMHYPGKPVRLQWERSDDMAWEPYGSAMHIEVSADLNDAGDVDAWRYNLWSCPHSSRPRSTDDAGNMIYAQLRKNPLPLPPVQSIAQPNGGADRNGIPLYAFANLQVNKHLVTDVPLRVSALRGLGAYANVFAIESFMDELALRAGVDPLDYRLRHLQDERAIALLQRLAEMTGWYQRPASTAADGWGLGFARFKNRSSYTGIIMRVAVDEHSGKIRLKKATAVCDAGLVVNPNGASAQIEGGIVQSSSWTLKEQINFSLSEKKSLDWVTYPILRFDEIPDIDVAFMPRDGEPSLGVGETAQGPTAAAIGNAIFAATGQRLRKLPLQPA